MEVVELSVDYGGRRLTLQTGKLAKQADASVLVTYGETMVLVNVCSSKELKDNQDFFPLTVDFQEKYYAAGRFPGGFFKREAKPSDRATLSARLIDRPSRPLFPEDFLCDTFITATVLSVDGINEADIAASIGASAALHMSDIPWGGPFASCRVGHIDGQFVLNPSPADAANSRMEVLISALKTGVVMVEGAAKEVSEAEMVEALEFAHKSMMPVLELQEELRKRVGKAKRDYPKPAKNEALKKEMRSALTPDFKKAFAIKQKLERYNALAEVKAKAKEKFAKKDAATKEDAAHNKLVSVYLEELKGAYARDLTLNSGHRIDGRDYKDIRPITCEIGLLPRVHGSALFTRGETQVLGAVTLGTSDDEQKIDSINGIYQKTFLLHYNFPPFSVGEARPLRPPGRREVGHGVLAERALAYVIPSKEVFPYSIRLVSEVLESNGSSSMATVCSGSMALMQAGVPIPKAVAGVAMGLIKEEEKYRVLSDILGDEDHLGDMDFKVCGTKDGITAFQMDLKIGGVSREIMTEALDQAREGRMHILGKMAEAIAEPAKDFSQYAPRIFTVKVRPEKVREVIGSGGKVVRGIIEKTGVKIDIEDDGTIHIASVDQQAAAAAIKMIEAIVEEAEPGRIYEGRVSRIAEFGAFIEIMPGTDGLCHISELDHHRVRRVEDVLKEGDVVQVKCLEVDPTGKIRLSRKALLPRPEGMPESSGGGGDRGPRGGGDRDRGRDRDRGDRGPRGGGDRDRGDRDRGDRPARAESTPAVAAEGGDTTPEKEIDPAVSKAVESAPRTSETGDEQPSLGSERRPARRELSEDDANGPGNERPSPDRDRGPRGGGDRDRGDRDRSASGDRGPRGGGDRDRGDRDRSASSDRGPDRGPSDRPSSDRGEDFGNRRSASDEGGRGGSDRGPRGGGDRDPGLSRVADRGGRGGSDRGPRGGGDRDRGGRGGSDRGPRGGGDRDRGGPSRSSSGGGGDRDRNGYRASGEDRGNRSSGGDRDRDSSRSGGGYGDRDRGGNFGNDRGGGDRGGSDRGNDRGDRGNERSSSDRSSSDRGPSRSGSDRPSSDRSGSDRPRSDRGGNERPRERSFDRSGERTGGGGGERGGRHFDRDRGGEGRGNAGGGRGPSRNPAPTGSGDRPRREAPVSNFEEPEFQPRDYREEPLGYPPNGDDDDR